MSIIIESAAIHMAMIEAIQLARSLRGASSPVSQLRANAARETLETLCQWYDTDAGCEVAEALDYASVPELRI